MGFFAQLPDYWEAFVRLAYPSYCGACRAFLALDERDICHACRAKLPGLLFTPEESASSESLESLDEAWTLFPYASPVREIITGIKFEKKRWLVRTFEEAVTERARMLAAENHYDALVPVPVSKRTLVKREFNQAELIAGLVRKATGIPIASRLLAKRSGAAAQSHLTREERQVNLRGIFRKTGGSRIRGLSFLLIDDIMTTGATAAETARILKQHGARRVDLFALARTLRAS
ncbi:MAG: phosphoribosyltransferase family protein [Candidatus Omnitrophota bacterium]